MAVIRNSSALWPTLVWMSARVKRTASSRLGALIEWACHIRETNTAIGVNVLYYGQLDNNTSIYIPFTFCNVQCAQTAQFSPTPIATLPHRVPFHHCLRLSKRPKTQNENLKVVHTSLTSLYICWRKSASYAIGMCGVRLQCSAVHHDYANSQHVIVGNAGVV